MHTYVFQCRMNTTHILCTYILKKTNHSKEFRTRWFRQFKESTDSEVDVVAASDGLPSVYCLETMTISRSSVSRQVDSARFNKGKQKPCLPIWRIT